MSRVRIADLVRFQRGVSWSSIQEHSEPGPGRVPVIRIPNIRDQLDVRDLVYLSGIDDTTRTRAAVSKGWLLLVGSNGNPERIGNAVLVQDDTDYLFASFLVGVKPTTSRINGDFLLRLLSSDEVKALLRRTVRGSTGLQNINLPALANYEFDLPTMSEQLWIAKVLDTLDDQIRTTEQMIDKLKLTRDGRIVEVLTRGLQRFGSTADCRSLESHVELTAVGPVPLRWQIAFLATFQRRDRPYLKTGPFGSSLKQEHWVDEGVPVVTIGSLGEGTFLESELLYVTPRTAAQLSSYALDTGDIVFSRVADVGRSVVIGDREKNWIMSSNMMWISLDPSTVDPRFVRANIASNPYVRLQIRRFVNSAGRDVANAKIMNLLKFPWPSIDEQVAIADEIESWDKEVAAEESRVTKLQLLKRGLIADLLTDRVASESGA